MPRTSFLLRTDPKVLEALRQWAEDDFRSLNAQIEFLLRQTLVKSGRLKDLKQPPDEPEQGETD
ncbi:type II toxin-antitoxin system antitoxin [Lacunimicrobium album]